MSSLRSITQMRGTGSQKQMFRPASWTPPGRACLNRPQGGKKLRSVKHRAFPQCWECFDALSMRGQELARRNYELLKENFAIPLSISRRSDDIALSGSVCNRGPWAYKSQKASFGSELGRMQSTTNYWANKALNGTSFSLHSKAASELGC